MSKIVSASATTPWQSSRVTWGAVVAVLMMVPDIVREVVGLNILPPDVSQVLLKVGGVCLAIATIWNRIAAQAAVDNIQQQGAGDPPGQEGNSNAAGE